MVKGASINPIVGLFPRRVASVQEKSADEYFAHRIYVEAKRFSSRRRSERLLHRHYLTAVIIILGAYFDLHVARYGKPQRRVGRLPKSISTIDMAGDSLSLPSHYC